MDVRHLRSAAQVVALTAGELDLALVRARPVDPDLDAILWSRSRSGVLLSADRAAEVADATGVPLQRLAGLDWVGFPRRDTPAWHDQVTATLRGHGVAASSDDDADDVPITSEVKPAAVGTGRAFALASPGWAQPLPDGLSWHPLLGDLLIRRTWAVWSAGSRRRDLAALVDALDHAPARTGLRRTVADAQPDEAATMVTRA